MNKTLFINAYIWIFGTTRKDAVEAWKTLSNDYKEIIIETYENNFKSSFYND